jgi:hypothetical protein
MPAKSAALFLDRGRCAGNGTTATRVGVSGRSPFVDNVVIVGAAAVEAGVLTGESRSAAAISRPNSAVVVCRSAAFRASARSSAR